MLGRHQFVIFTFLFILHINKTSTINTTTEHAWHCAEGSNQITYPSLEAYRLDDHSAESIAGFKVSFEVPRIEVLNNDTFISIIDELMTELILERKDIFEVNNGAFHSLRCLKSLILCDNYLSAITTDVFKGLHELSKLDLRKNFISNLFNDTFHHLKKLNVLDLSQNLIESIEVGTFNELEFLHVLLLNHNRLNVLALDMFQGPWRLQVLFLNNCMLVNLLTNGDHPAELKNLQKLNIAHNRLFKQLPDVGYPALKELHLEFNYLETFNMTRIKNNCPALERLYIQNNSFKCDEIDRILPSLDEYHWDTYGIAECDKNPKLPNYYPTFLAYLAFALLIPTCIASFLIVIYAGFRVYERCTRGRVQ